jgi:hypothetical protein
MTVSLSQFLRPLSTISGELQRRETAKNGEHRTFNFQRSTSNQKPNAESRHAEKEGRKRMRKVKRKAQATRVVVRPKRWWLPMDSIRKQHAPKYFGLCSELV